MCGIFGVVKLPKDKVIVDDLTDSLRNLAHRGSDASGVYTHENLGLGHQRLAIFDTSAKGNQPMSSWGLTITFNGAIYNFPELRQELMEANYQFTSQTDTEVILAAYHHWGEDCVKKFNGQWAFAIYDPIKKIIFCSRDRFGIKPFYYTWINGAFYFASEIKAFLPIDGWKAKLNVTRAVEYLVHQMHDHTSETFFEQVFLLEKSHHLKIDLQTLQLSKKQYYNLDNIQTLNLSDQEAIHQYRTLFEDSLRLRLRTDVPLGAALSGGLDSSAIALTIPKISKLADFHTFSVVYEQKAISEKPFLEKVLAQSDFKPTYLSPALEDLKKSTKHLLWHQEEPFNGFGVYAQHLLFQAASKKGIKVMLDGQGADEILAGYEKFFFILLKKQKKHPLDFLKLLWHVNTKHRLDFRQLSQRFSQYRSKSNTSFPNWINATVEPKRIFQRQADTSIAVTSKNLIYELGLGALLRYEDKNAMAYGIESRVPYLDHRLVEFCLALPDDLKIRKGIRKWIQRESMKDRLPKILYHRYDKLGFATPQDQWLQQQRSKYIKDLSSNFQSLEKLIHPDYNLQSLDTLTLWRMTILQQWIEQFEVEH